MEIQEGREGLTLCVSRVAGAAFLSGYNISPPAGWPWGAEPLPRRAGRRQRSTRGSSPSRSLPKGQGTAVSPRAEARQLLVWVMGVWKIIVPRPADAACYRYSTCISVQVYMYTNLGVTMCAHKNTLSGAEETFSWPVLNSIITAVEKTPKNTNS